MNVVLTLGRCAPPGSDAVYLDFRRYEISRGRDRVRLWPRAFSVVSAVLSSTNWLTTKDLIEHLYAGQKDGGPVTADKCIHTYFCHARNRLMPLGIGFRSHWTAGYSAVDLWAERAQALAA